MQKIIFNRIFLWGKTKLVEWLFYSVFLQAMECTSSAGYPKLAKLASTSLFLTFIFPKLIFILLLPAKSILGEHFPALLFLFSAFSDCLSASPI